MEKTTNKLVKDYLGNLIPKSRARKIMDKYYEEGVSCHLMEDGQWYRITSKDKIVYDYYKCKYTLRSHTNLMKGIIDETGKQGDFSENDFVVYIRDIKGNQTPCLNEEIVLKLGYVESLSDGYFYDVKGYSKDQIAHLFKKGIPSHERSKSYNLESDLERKRELENCYKNLKLKTSASSVEISKFLGNFTFGAEFEVVNGFIPKRIRNKYGIKALKDGSLRWEGGEGIEYVSMPMGGAKGVQVLREFGKELGKRCEVNNLCALHFHFGNVRRDKLYVLSLYHIIELIQAELKTYFPYSRFNSIKEDGKLYCKPLENLGINYGSILNSKDEDEFHKKTIAEFSKFYRWLNNGRDLAEEYGERQLVRENKVIGGKKYFQDKWLKTIYTTKSVYHAITGNKWDKPQRYYNINFLNLFFNKMGTIEFRCHESSTNPTKILNWLIICASILKFAEDIKRGLTLSKLSLREILETQLPKKYSDYLMAYMESRHNEFYTKEGGYKTQHKSVEKKWFDKDPNYTFKHGDFEIK